MSTRAASMVIPSFMDPADAGGMMSPAGLMVATSKEGAWANAAVASRWARRKAVVAAPSFLLDDLNNVFGGLERMQRAFPPGIELARDRQRLAFPEHLSRHQPLEPGRLRLCTPRPSRPARAFHNVVNCRFAWARCRCSEVDDPYLEYAPEQFYIKMAFTNSSSGRRPRSKS